MTKPVIVLRSDTAPSPLTYTQLDANFTNLQNSTINFTGDAGDTRSMDLNDSTQIVGNKNIQVTVDEATQKITVKNTLSDYALDPIGFENLTDATVSFNDSTRTLTIAPTGASYRYWWKGKQITVTSSKTITIPNTSGNYLIYFDDETLSYQVNTEPNWATQVTVSYVAWNATSGQSMFSKELHGISMDWKTKEYLHETQGAQYAEGLAISNYTTTGTGSSNADAQLDIADGIIYDQDIAVEITHSNTPTANTWQQDLQGPARIPVVYHSGSNGGWVRDSARDYAVKNGTSLVTYNLNTAGNWTTPDITSTHYVAYWIVATNFLNNPIISIMGQRHDNKLTDAVANNTWASLDLTNFPAQELRPLYRVIFRSGSAYANTPKAYIAQVDDFRLSTIIPQGGITSGVQSVSGTAGRISSTGGVDPVLDLVTTSVSAGSYTAASITVDAYGRITSASSNTFGNLFYNISDGVNTAVPDSSTDTLTFTGSSPVSVSVNPTNDTVTIGFTSGSIENRISQTSSTPTSDNMKFFNTFNKIRINNESWSTSATGNHVSYSTTGVINFQAAAIGSTSGYAENQHIALTTNITSFTLPLLVVSAQTFSRGPAKFRVLFTNGSNSSLSVTGWTDGNSPTNLTWIGTSRSTINFSATNQYILLEFTCVYIAGTGYNAPYWTGETLMTNIP